MIETFNLILLAGGQTLCTPSTWNKSASSIDHCFKLYFPVRGSAKIRLNTEWHTIEPKQYSLINGYQIQEQRCQQEWGVFWIHFIPTSLELRYMLSQGPGIFHWPKQFNQCHHCALDTLPQLFDGTHIKVKQAALVCRIQAMLLYLVADYLRQNKIDSPSQDNSLFARIKPSIDFINTNICTPQSLTDIAAQSHLAPTYFHRLFKELFNTTPLAYMTRRRLDMARQLLTATSLGIKEIALRVGYENEFYFSRIFNKHFNVSPKEFRRSFTHHA